ncbi:hypothetical protein M404DRAFT_35383 [Pisolithus tinctorius Marx 270]|uniref:Uncharacterized protein n=1 Tax=Pisolithus tinctorius Marx 270 TaxID=870435 RepID=A0A0C3J8Q2_PISTI|nr:hypothetical protein M404DRAFT_35383 [Pisolithus tinctorius Marx 270]
MRTTTSTPTTTSSAADDPGVEQSPPPAPLTTTSSPLREPPSGDQPSFSKPDSSSTPSTDTLPSLRASVPAASASSQTTPSSNTQLPSTMIQGTIGAVRPILDSRLFDPDCISTCPESLLKRIKLLSTYSNQDANTFVLGQILPSATWGTTDPYEDRSKILCNPSTNEPVNIWILGHITSTWFMKSGAPDNQCAVTILTLSSNLGQYANLLLSKFSESSLRTHSPIHITKQALKYFLIFYSRK